MKCGKIELANDEITKHTLSKRKVEVGSGFTGISSHSGAKLPGWANRQAEASCNSWAAMLSNDSEDPVLCTFVILLVAATPN